MTTNDVPESDRLMADDMPESERRFRCTRCADGVDFYEEDGRTIRDACYHCGATGWIDDETHRYDRLQAIVAQFAVTAAHERRARMDMNEDGEDFAFCAAENMMTTNDLFTEIMWSCEAKIGAQMDALPREMQDVLLAWNEALVAAYEERQATEAARREAARREPAAGSYATAGLDSTGEPW